jgi:hypothetical protein
MGLLLLMMQAVKAQTFNIENIVKISPQSLNAIKEGTEVKGYYFFYISDKIDKKTNEYTLKIFDDNLKSLKDIKFQDSKDVTVLESSFNGADLMFLFYNAKERTFDFQLYGADGKKKPFSYNRELSKKEQNYLRATYNLLKEKVLFLLCQAGKIKTGHFNLIFLQVKKESSGLTIQQKALKKLLQITWVRIMVLYIWNY